jgi:serine/threonine-protein kinase
VGLLSEGQIIRETYEVERFLGEGAFGEVYRVRHRFLGRQAMKVFKMAGMSLAETEQMLGEAILLSRIGHPNIIRVFDANVVETEFGLCGFFTMEYVAGGSLDQFWRSFGNRMIPVETTVDIIRQVCQGIAVAHSESPPVIHRDIKPQNILVGYDPAGLRIRISDFGLAKKVNPLTLLASAQGTLCFKSPEIFRNCQNDSCAGDVWAIGATLYLLLTDRLPYQVSDDGQVLDMSAFDKPLILPARLNIQVDAELERIVLRALALKPESRYQTAQEMLEDLNQWSHDGIGKSKELPPAETSKLALGAHSTANEKRGREMAERALEMTREAGQLIEAADLMEEAFNQWPQLRDEYEYRLTLWRRGIAM